MTDQARRRGRTRAARSSSSSAATTASATHRRPFDPGRDPVRYAGRVFGEEEMRLLVDSSLDFYLTASRFTEEFEAGVADYLGLSDALFVNSGSSANLVALTTLTSPKLGDRRLQPGDEVITVAAGFPSTVAPIVQNGLVPVFVDVRLGDYNADPEQLRAAISPRTRAIMLAHTLGVPFDLDTVMELVEAHDLWFVEDNCDALGSRYRDRLTGTFGHLATSSFYPAHHITTGEGGMVVTDDDDLARIARSIRDWGRDCYCAGGENNTCGKRFSQQFGSLPYGYDHKYVYSHLGYNLKATDMQAAIGVAQLAPPRRVHRRRASATTRGCSTALRPYEDRLILPVAPPRHGSVLVLLRHHGPRRRRLHAGRPDGVPRGESDRDAQPVQRQPAAPSGLRDDRAPGRRRPREHRHRHERHVLRRRLPGDRRCPAGLHDRRRSSGSWPARAHGMAAGALGADGPLSDGGRRPQDPVRRPRDHRSRRARLHRRARAVDRRCRTFKPGQFLHLAIDPYDGAGFWPESRVFSIASSPGERDRLDDHVRRQGRRSRRGWSASWCPAPPSGSSCRTASSSSIPRKDAVLFAGGTGVTAFTAFLRSLDARPRAARLLFYGARTPDLFVYGALVEALRP